MEGRVPLKWFQPFIQNVTVEAKEYLVSVVYVAPIQSIAGKLIFTNLGIKLEVQLTGQR